VAQLFPRVPQLPRIGFTFMRSMKTRALVPVTGATVTEMRGQVKRSQLFLLPKRDLLQTVCALLQLNVVSRQHMPKKYLLLIFFYIISSRKTEMLVPFLCLPFIRKIYQNLYCSTVFEETLISIRGCFNATPCVKYYLLVQLVESKPLQIPNCLLPCCSCSQC
jgi:hypothetical protein